MANTPTINRDVGEQSKGPRLQKLRAINHLLEVIEGTDQVNVYCAVEFDGDVFVANLSGDTLQSYHEEDKNYDLATKFSLMSTEVRNTLVIFLDCWAKWKFSKNVHFCFYTPNEIAAERNTDTSKALGITWPSKPVLGMIASGCHSEPDVIRCLKAVVLAEYRNQYDDPKCPGYFEAFATWSDSDWTDFLRQIHWKFGAEDDVVLEAKLIEKIRLSRHFNESIKGKEKHIISSLIAELDSRQSKTDTMNRCIHSAEVILLFRDVGAGIRKPADPAWKTWSALPPPGDTRNLKLKVEDVTDPLTSAAVGRWSRCASNSLAEQDELRHDKSLLSLKYQVFDACETALVKMIKANQCQKCSEEAIEIWIETLIDVAQARLTDRSCDYHYPRGSREFLRGIVWELVDSCFLAFDAGAINV